MRPEVLIVTRSTDNECVDRVASAIEARGGRAFRLDTDRFPTELRLASSPGGARTLTDGERTVDLDALAGIWHRRLQIGGRIPEDMDPQLRDASLKESRRALMGTITSLDAFTVDPLRLIRHAESKELQLRVAAAAGLETPRTLVSNDPEAVRAFWEACDGRVVTKMLASFAVLEDGREKVVFTNRLEREHLDDLDGLRFSPMVFQELVPKRLELRVTVAGEQVLTASIDSQAEERARTDWRREGAAMVGRWQPFELPDDVRRRVLALQDALGLNYGAIDLVLTPDERLVFLEVNPVGEFFWLERAPGLPVSEALADVLLGRAPRREAPPPTRAGTPAVDAS